MRDIKPTHKPIKAFYAELKQFKGVSGSNQIREDEGLSLDEIAQQDNITVEPRTGFLIVNLRNVS